MAYPPSVPPADRSDSTLAASRHPQDHNTIAVALAAIIAELGANPSGGFADLSSRLGDPNNPLQIDAVVAELLADPESTLSVLLGDTFARQGATGRTDLGLGTIATHPTSDFHAQATTGTGIYKNPDAALKPAYTIGNTPNSGGFPGTGYPETPSDTRVLGPIALYQTWGDDVNHTAAPIPYTTQVGYVLGNYWGPTLHDSAEAWSVFVGMKDPGGGATYTQSKKTTAFEAIAQVENGVTHDKDAEGGYVLAIGATVKVLAGGKIEQAYGVKADANTSGGPFGTLERYTAFAQTKLSGATIAAYGVYVFDPIATETKVVLGKSAYSGSLSMALTGNTDGQKSFILLNLPTSADTTGGTTGIRIVGASDQTKDLVQGYAPSESGGSPSFYVDSAAIASTRKGIRFKATMADPTSVAGETRLYNRDNGSGSAELVAMFPNGHSRKLATEAPADPVGFGICTTFAPGVVGTQAAWAAANNSRYGRVLSGGIITKIGFHVGTSSGNVSVSVYRNTGTGRTAKPGTQAATSGSVACPAAGYQEVALGATVTVEAGDWLAMSCDNTTATFAMASNVDSDIYAGMAWRGATEHPLPATVGALTASTNRMPLLIGT